MPRSTLSYQRLIRKAYTFKKLTRVFTGETSHCGGNMKSGVMLGGNIFGYFTDYSQTKEMLDFSFEHGIRAIDTSDSYSDGVSEDFIGRSILGSRREWFIATKAGLRSGESPNGLGRRERLISKVQASLVRLRTDIIDLYQLHNYDPVTPLDETVEAFEEMIKRGYIRGAGVCNFVRSNAFGHVQFKPHIIGYMQEPVNITLNNDWLKQHNTGKVLAYAVLNRGLLNEKYITGMPLSSRASLSKSISRELTPSYLSSLESCQMICRSHGTDLVSVALHYVLNMSEVWMAIVGARSKSQLMDLSLRIRQNVPSGAVDACRAVFARL